MNNQRVILHIDMNSYFASVEQQANPFLRGKPVGVCAYLSPRGCIIASSVEAKKIGIKTGMRVMEAQAINPGVILLENEPAKYRSVTEKIFSILAGYSDRIEPYSIDEAFIDLTGWVYSHSCKSSCVIAREHSDRSNPKNRDCFASLAMTNTYAIALEIKHRIRTEVGEWLRCSIGIAHTRWLAKFASDIAPKDGILVLDTEKEIDKYLNQPVVIGWGIGDRLGERLNRLNIFTLLELKKYPPGNLLQIFGKPGYYLWANVNGIEIEGVKTAAQTKPKSIGHSYCLPKKTADLGYLRPVLMKLCEKTGRRLRESGVEARTIAAGMSFVEAAGRYKTKRLGSPLFDTGSIYNAAAKIVFSDSLPDRARMLAVSVSGFIPIGGQQTLFGDALKIKNAALAMDKINKRYGDFTILLGEMFGTQNCALDRIGFRKTLDIPE